MARYEAKSIGLGVLQNLDGDVVPGQPFALAGGPLYAAETGPTELIGAGLQFDAPTGKLPGWLDPDTDPGVYALTVAGVTVKFTVGEAGLAARTDSLESSRAALESSRAALESGHDLWPARPSNSAAQNKTAIDLALANRLADGGGVVELNDTGRIDTNGGHLIGPGVRMHGLGWATKLVNRGAGTCVTLMDETSDRPACGLRDLKIVGALSGVPAISGSIGLELGNGYGYDIENVWIDGFNDAGVGLKFHNTDSVIDWTGGHHLRHIAVVNCTKCVQFIADAAAQEWFGDIDIADILLQPSASQVGLWFGKSHFYNNTIQGHLYYAGNNAIGLEIATADAKVRQGSRFDIRGEIDPAFTGCKRIKMTAAGQFDATGKIFIANAVVPDDLAGGGVFNFVEDELSYYEAVALHDRILASAAALTIPGGSSFFEVTGTTSITSIPTSWEGRVVTLKFAGILTVTDGGNLRLAGNFVTSADDTITLVHRSGVWYEVCRSAN